MKSNSNTADGILDNICKTMKHKSAGKRPATSTCKPHKIMRPTYSGDRGATPRMVKFLGEMCIALFLCNPFVPYWTARAVWLAVQ